MNNKKTLQSVVIAENYIEDIRLAREINPGGLKTTDDLKNWLSSDKDWLDINENLVDFEIDGGLSQAIIRKPDSAKGVLYTTRISYTIVEEGLYRYIVEVSQPNASTYTLSSMVFIKY